MSYGFPEQQPQSRRPKSGGSFFFLILLAAGAFFLMQQMRTAGPEANEREFPQQPAEDRDFDPLEGIGSNTPTPKAHPNQGDFTMEEVPVKRTEETTASSSKSTGTGGFSGEELPATRANSDFEIDFPNSKSTPKSKTTRQGDWEASEVPSKKDN